MQSLLGRRQMMICKLTTRDNFVIYAAINIVFELSGAVMAFGECIALLGAVAGRLPDVNAKPEPKNIAARGCVLCYRCDDPGGRRIRAPGIKEPQEQRFLKCPASFYRGSSMGLNLVGIIRWMGL
jgi:hypothetical protein